MSEIPGHLQNKQLDIHIKMEMAKKIVKECFKEKQNSCLSIILRYDLHRFKFYTGFKPVNLCNIIDDLIKENKMSKKFRDDLALYSIDNKIYGCLESYDKIRDFVHNMYIAQRAIPSIKEASTIKDAFIRHTKKNYDAKLKWTFKRRGFVLKQLPGTSKAVIVERAEQIRNRNEYLNRIRHYREINRHILYVVDAQLPSLYLEEFFHIEDYSLKFLIMAAFPAGGWVKTQVRSNANFANNFLHFALSVIPFLPESSVIVIDEDHDIIGDVQKKPTAFSGKQDMITWLETNEVPHDPNDHRAELYKLVEKTRKLSNNLGKFSELMEGYGHTVLIKPECSAADYFKGVYSQVLKKLPDENIFNNKKNVLAKDLSAAINTLTAEELRDCERILIETEIKVIDEDMMVEEIVDKVLTMAKYEQISDTDLAGLDTYRIEVEQSLVVRGDQDYKSLLVL